MATGPLGQQGLDGVWPTATFWTRLTGHNGNCPSISLRLTVFLPCLSLYLSHSLTHSLSLPVFDFFFSACLTNPVPLAPRASQLIFQFSTAIVP